GCSLGCPADGPGAGGQDVAEFECDCLAWRGACERGRVGGDQLRVVDLSLAVDDGECAAVDGHGAGRLAHGDREGGWGGGRWRGETLGGHVGSDDGDQDLAACEGGG